MADHPPLEHLAEYADGTIESTARAELEAHLLRCVDCRDLVAETSAFLTEDERLETDPCGHGEGQ